MFKQIIATIFLFGITTSLPQHGRVVNGTDATENEFPYVVSLRGSTGSHSCGGSIINERCILTAAHCVGGEKYIQYGVTKIDSSNKNVVKVEKTIVHEGYNPSNTYENDIAVLILSSPMTLSKSAQPVILPQKDQEFEHGTPAILVGWGLDKSGGYIQENLQKVDLQTYSDEECNRIHHGRTHLSNICGGVPEGGKGQCSGDSGGPLCVNGVQVGLVSWSIKPCAVYPYPGVYTKVSHYTDWINEKCSNF